MSIIHADLALRNILLAKGEGEQEYQAKISDFGLRYFFQVENNIN